MKQNIKYFIILALLLTGNVIAWATTKTITYTLTWTLENVIDGRYSLEGDNGESHVIGDPEGGNLTKPYSIDFQDFTLTINTSDTYCHIANLTGLRGFYGHDYAFTFESTNYYITHVTVKGIENMAFKTAGTDNYSKSCTVNWPYDNVVVQQFIVTLVDKLDISLVTVTGIDDNYDFTGSAITPSPVVTLTTGAPSPVSLTEGTDYTVNYVNNTDVGTATVIVTGTGEYTGSWSKTFAINKVAATVTPPTPATTTYNGTEQALCGGATVTGGTLMYSVDGGTTWSEDVPTATVVGTYDVYYRVDADQNHTGVAATLAGTATINARQRTFGTVTVTDGNVSAVDNTIVIADGTDAVTIPEDVAVGSITMNRTFTVGKSATIMLPFDIDIAKISGGTFYGFIGIDKLGASGWEVVMSQVGGTLQAHTPYLFIPTAETMTFNLGGETVTLKANSEQTYTVQP